MSTLARIIYELLSIWEQFKADQKRLKRDELIKKARKDPVDFLNNHFDRVSDDAENAGKADKTKH